MRQSGYTFVELLVVVVIVGAVAAAVVATQTSVDSEQTLDAAASEVAAAFRFARSEALRTGEPHGVDANSFSKRVRVYRLDTSVSPPVVDYSVRHPIDKKLYDLNFATDPFLEPVDLASVLFWFEGVMFPSGFCGFEASGTPKYEDFAGVHMLTSGTVTLTAGGETRTVSVAPMNGRVTIQ